MPAINPAQLKIQCTELSESFSNPQAFIPRLHNLLNFYADRVSRPGETSPTPLMINAYHVSPPVMRHLEREIAPLVQSSPLDALSLADALWEEEYLETRHLAAVVLGHISPASPDPILERVQQWMTSCQEGVLQRVIATHGLAKIKSQYPEEYLKLAAALIESTEKSVQRGGLYTLIPLLKEDAFQNLPVVYQMLSRLLNQEKTSLKTEIIAVVEQLAKRSEQETAFFLKEKLLTAAQPRITRIVRRSLPFFSKEYESKLRNELRNKK